VAVVMSFIQYKICYTYLNLLYQQRRLFFKIVLPMF